MLSNFKIGQKVKMVVPSIDGQTNKVFKGFVVTAVKESTSKTVELSYNKKPFYELFFHLDGSVKKATDSTLNCHIIDEKAKTLDIQVGVNPLTKEPIMESKTLGPEGKDIFKEIKDQYQSYVSKRKAESERKKSERKSKQASASGSVE